MRTLSVGDPAKEDRTSLTALMLWWMLTNPTPSGPYISSPTRRLFSLRSLLPTTVAFFFAVSKLSTLCARETRPSAFFPLCSLSIATTASLRRSPRPDNTKDLIPGSVDTDKPRYLQEDLVVSACAFGASFHYRHGVIGDALSGNAQAEPE